MGTKDNAIELKSPIMFTLQSSKGLESYLNYIKSNGFSSESSVVNNALAAQALPATAMVTQPSTLFLSNSNMREVHLPDYPHAMGMGNMSGRGNFHGNRHYPGRGVGSDFESPELQSLMMGGGYGGGRGGGRGVMPYNGYGGGYGGGRGGGRGKS